MAPAAAPELVEALRAAGAAVYPLVILTDGSLQQDVRSLVPEHPPAGKSERDRP
ncbi:MAG: hypothetical protein JF607_26115 [Burkholderiales bacterium]|nr:hypothetical protein [Burkholderiales bacterium]